MARIAYVEPFEGGSHQAFGRSLRGGLPEHEWTEFSMPARHWKWRMRGAGVHLADDPRWDEGVDLLFASSYLALADLLALRPELHAKPRVLYFHENQLAFPMRPEFSGERDLHYGVTQMMSCLAATQCWFNSRYNLDSFIDAARRLLQSMPDAKCPQWVERIEARSRVMPLPLELPALPPRGQRAQGRPLVVWNHRWEYDKAPQRLFEGVDAALDKGLELRLAVVGERFKQVPACFAKAKSRFDANPLVDLEACGFLESRADYWELLNRADLVVSTAKHEFFGISMMEAAHAGADVLVPDDLAYVELFPDACRYPPQAFGEALCDWLENPPSPPRANPGLAASFAAERVLPRYRAALNELL